MSAPGMRARRPALRGIILTLPALATALLVFTAAAPAAKPSSKPKRQNVLLISVASLRADRLGSYSGGKFATPHIDRLSARGARFERAYTASPSTIASAGSLLTGRLPIDTGLRHDLGGRLKDEVPTLAEAFRKAGYRTGAVLGSFMLDSDRGLGRGFQTYEDEFEGIRKMKVTLSKERRAEEGARKALAWLDQDRKAGPFFLWADFFDPHYDYEAPEGFKPSQPGDPYQGEVGYLDAQICVLLDGLRERKLDAATHIVLAGLHGEGLGDHGETGHGTYLYETTIRVPLLVAPAAGREAAAVTEAVSLLDVAPTLLALNGLPVPDGMDGRPLVPVHSGDGKAASGPRRIFVEAYSPYAAYGWSPMYAAIEANRKVVVGRRTEAFDLSADPGETKPLNPAPDWSIGLAGFGRPLLGTVEPPKGLREEVRRLVDDLDPPWNYSPICMEKIKFPDPRDRVELNGPLFRARIDSYWRVVGRAANISRDEVLPKDPTNYTALDLTAFLSLRNGWTEYLLHDLELVQCNYPLRPLAYHYYGHALEKAGDTARAEKALRIYALLEPDNEEPYYDLAVRYALAGKKDLALDHLARSIRLGAEDLAYIRRDARLASIRDDPRFSALVGPVAPTNPSR